MVLTQIIRKNFKLLFRSRASSLVLLFAPLLIILFAGLAFNTSEGFKFNIGTYVPEKTELAQSYLDKLSDSQFNVVSYDSIEECKRDLEQGVLHSCIEFPKDFTLSNKGSNELVVYADTTKMNVVWIVLDAISSKIDVKSTELSLDMTVKLLNVIDVAKEGLLKDKELVISSKSDDEFIGKVLDNIGGDIDTINEQVGVINPQNLLGHVSSLEVMNERLNEDTLKLIDRYRELVDLADTNNSDLDKQAYLDMADALEATVLKNKNADSSDGNNIPWRLEQIRNGLEGISEGVQEIEDKLGKTGGSETLSERVNEIRDKAGSISTNLGKLEDSFNSILDLIDSVPISDAESIVAPTKTRIEPITKDSSSISLVFQYFIAMIVMFIGILLSAIIVIMEKNSKAYFRNFTTPTSDTKFIVATYLTSLTIVLFQVLLILVLLSFFTSLSIFNSSFLWLLLGLLLMISVFSLIGALVGYLMTSEEATTLLAICVSSVLLLVSDAILPIESMPFYVQAVAKLNPFVLSSSLIRELVQFRTGIAGAWFELAMLLLYGIALFILVVAVKKASKRKYFAASQTTATISEYLEEAEFAEEKSLKLGGRVVKNKEELVKALQEMSDDEFEKYADLDKNLFADWIEEVYKDSLLAQKARNRNRKGLIELLTEKKKK